VGLPDPVEDDESDEVGDDAAGDAVGVDDADREPDGAAVPDTEDGDDVDTAAAAHPLRASVQVTVTEATAARPMRSRGKGRDTSASLLGGV